MVNAQGVVTTFLNGVYVGGVQLPDVGAWKGPGKIGIQLQTHRRDQQLQWRIALSTVHESQSAAER